MITHASPQKRDLTYDQRTERFVMSIDVHHLDGKVEPIKLVLTHDEMAVHAIQVEQAYHKHREAPEVVA
ncbi:hypothetical protein ACFY41_24585 [Streptomyces syringium]|uniref:hypothetical protein n=1 Tax=Streptomyces syringium TaxID=76729 RepID=UPI0036CEA652